MIGRAHRNGQREIVFVFRIIAQNTIDVLMAQRAGAKADQLEKFFTKKESNNVINRSKRLHSLSMSWPLTKVLR